MEAILQSFLTISSLIIVLVGGMYLAIASYKIAFTKLRGKMKKRLEKRSKIVFCFGIAYLIFGTSIGVVANWATLWQMS